MAVSMLSFITVVAIGALSLAGPVHLESRTECLGGQDLVRRTNEVLHRHEAAEHLSVTISDAPATSGVLATLRVLMAATGEVLLQRRFDLRAEDCPSTGDLMLVVLNQFLEQFPLQERIAKARSVPAPEKVYVTRDVAELAGLAFLAVDSRWPEPSADLEIGASLDVGSARHRLVGTTAMRIGIPQALGSGHYLETMGLLGVGWRFARTDWMLRTEVRTGGLMVSGFGHPENYHRWLLWVEVQVGLMWKWRGVLLGAHIAVSPLWHRVETSAGASRQLPWHRAGVSVGFPFWYRKF